MNHSCEASWYNVCSLHIQSSHHIYTTRLFKIKNNNASWRYSRLKEKKLIKIPHGARSKSCFLSDFDDFTFHCVQALFKVGLVRLGVVLSDVDDLVLLVILTCVRQVLLLKSKPRQRHQACQKLGSVKSITITKNVTQHVMVESSAIQGTFV